MPREQRLAVGIIGTGGMGTRHAVNLHTFIGGARVAALYDPDRENATRAAALCGAPVVLGDPFQLIHDERVDALIIASPDDTHVDFVLEALRCGLPVLCEKPLATREADAAQVVEAEHALGHRLVSVGFMRRFDPSHVAVREVISSGKLGRAVLYKGVHRNATIPYDVTGEAVITNSAGHDIDAARWLLGQEVEEVYVRGVRSHATFADNAMDALLLQMVLSNATLASVEVFVAAEYGYEVSAEIVAERGTATTLQPDQALVRSQGTRALSVPGDWLERFQTAYVAELGQWTDAVLAGTTFPGASAWDALAALRVTDACVRSLQTRLPQPVQALPRPDLYRG